MADELPQRWTPDEQRRLARLKTKAKREGWADWIRDHRDEHALLTGHYFDPVEAERFRNFALSYVRHYSGRQFIGKPCKLLDWEWLHFFGPLMGWRRPSGRRRFNRGYVSTAKKNGKTFCCALLATYMLVADGEPSAFVASASTSRENASQIYDAIHKLILASPDLQQILESLPSTKTVVHQESMSKFVALCAKHQSVEGFDISCAIIDELHAHEKPDTFNALRYAGSAREQPIVPLAITTAGEAGKETICGQQYDYAKRVIRGQSDDGTWFYDDSFFALIYEATADDDPDDSETWKKANPSWGVTIDPVKFAEEWREAKATPTAWNTWRRYRLNQWVQNNDAFFDLTEWDKCNFPNVDPDELEGQECYMGLDISSRIDLTSAVLVFPRLDEFGVVERFDVLPFVWCPEGTVDKRTSDEGLPYRTWVEDEYMETTPGGYIDQCYIRERINEIGRKYKILSISTDRWETSKILVELRDDDGFDIEQHGMGFKSISSPMKDLEGMVIDRRINFFGHPVLRWMAGNTVVKVDESNNYRPDKKRSKDKIDGICALLLALSLAIDANEIAEWDGVIDYV